MQNGLLARRILRAALDPQRDLQFRAERRLVPGTYTVPVNYGLPPASSQKDCIPTGRSGS